MSNSSEIKPASQSIFKRLIEWANANLYLSLDGALAILITASSIIEDVQNFLHADQLELGVLALPFVALLDFLLIVLTITLFIRKSNGYLLLFNLIAILVMPIMGATVLVTALRSLSGVSDTPDNTTGQVIQGIAVVALAVVYIRDFRTRGRKTSQNHSAT